MGELGTRSAVREGRSLGQIPNVRPGGVGRVSGPWRRGAVRDAPCGPSPSTVWPAREEGRGERRARPMKIQTRNAPACRPGRSHNNNLGASMVPQAQADEQEARRVGYVL